MFSSHLSLNFDTTITCLCGLSVVLEYSINIRYCSHLGSVHPQPGNANIPIWAPSQYPKRRLIVRSREVSTPRDLYSELFDRCEIWQALRQQCCRYAGQISKRYDNLEFQSRGFETLRDLTKRRLFGYWDEDQISHHLIRCADNRMPEDSWDTDSLMMEEKPAAAADALETHIIGGKCQACCFFA